MFGLMTVKKHEAIVADLKAEIEALGKEYNKQFIEADRQRERRGSYKVQLVRALAELAHWKKYGQLRDPATGRLIPKAREKQVLIGNIDF